MDLPTEHRRTEAASLLAPIGFATCASIILPFALMVFLVEKTMFSRLIVVPPFLALMAATLYYYAGAQDWIQARTRKQVLSTVVLVGVPLGVVGLVLVLSVACAQWVCKLVSFLAAYSNRRRGRASPTWLWDTRTQWVMTLAVVLILFPALNALYFPNAIFREILPIRKEVSMANVLYSTNEFGFRGPVLNREKDARVVRLMFLGDSSTWGFPYPAKAVFPALVESELLERGVQVESINAGVLGYGIRQIKERLTSNLEWRPDVVFLMVGYHEQAGGYFEEDLFRGIPNHEFRPKFVPPMLFEMISAGLGTQFTLVRKWVFDSEKPASDLRALRGELGIVINLLRGSGAQVVFIRYPSPAIEQETQDAITRAVRFRGIDLIEPSPEMSFALNAFADDIHPDERGHALIAQSIVDWCLSPNGIPARVASARASF